MPIEVNKCPEWEEVLEGFIRPNTTQTMMDILKGLSNIVDATINEEKLEEFLQKVLEATTLAYELAWDSQEDFNEYIGVTLKNKDNLNVAVDVTKAHTAKITEEMMAELFNL